MTSMHNYVIADDAQLAWLCMGCVGKTMTLTCALLKIRVFVFFLSSAVVTRQATPDSPQSILTLSVNHTPSATITVSDDTGNIHNPVLISQQTQDLDHHVKIHKPTDDTDNPVPVSQDIQDLDNHVDLHNPVPVSQDIQDLDNHVDLHNPVLVSQETQDLDNHIDLHNPVLVSQETQDLDNHIDLHNPVLVSQETQDLDNHVDTHKPTNDTDNPVLVKEQKIDIPNDVPVNQVVTGIDTEQAHDIHDHDAASKVHKDTDNNNNYSFHGRQQADIARHPHPLINPNPKKRKRHHPLNHALHSARRNRRMDRPFSRRTRHLFSPAAGRRKRRMRRRRRKRQKKRKSSGKTDQGENGQQLGLIKNNTQRLPQPGIAPSGSVLQPGPEEQHQPSSDNDNDHDNDHGQEEKQAPQKGAKTHTVQSRKEDVQTLRKVLVTSKGEAKGTLETDPSSDPHRTASEGQAHVPQDHVRKEDKNEDDKKIFNGLTETSDSKTTRNRLKTFPANAEVKQEPVEKETQNTAKRVYGNMSGPALPAKHKQNTKNQETSEHAQDVHKTWNERHKIVKKPLRKQEVKSKLDSKAVGKKYKDLERKLHQLQSFQRKLLAEKKSKVNEKPVIHGGSADRKGERNKQTIKPGPKKQILEQLSKVQQDKRDHINLSDNVIKALSSVVDHYSEEFSQQEAILNQIIANTESAEKLLYSQVNASLKADNKSMEAGNRKAAPPAAEVLLFNKDRRKPSVNSGKPIIKSKKMEKYLQRSRVMNHVDDQRTSKNHLSLINKTENDITERLESSPLPKGKPQTVILHSRPHQLPLENSERHYHLEKPPRISYYRKINNEGHSLKNTDMEHHISNKPLSANIASSNYVHAKQHRFKPDITKAMIEKARADVGENLKKMNAADKSDHRPHLTTQENKDSHKQQSFIMLNKTTSLEPQDVLPSDKLNHEQSLAAVGTNHDDQVQQSKAQNMDVKQTLVPDTQRQRLDQTSSEGSDDTGKHLQVAADATDHKLRQQEKHKIGLQRHDQAVAKGDSENHDLSHFKQDPSMVNSDTADLHIYQTATTGQSQQRTETKVANEEDKPYPANRVRISQVQNQAATNVDRTSSAENRIQVNNDLKKHNHHLVANTKTTKQQHPQQQNSQPLTNTKMREELKRQFLPNHDVKKQQQGQSVEKSNVIDEQKTYSTSHSHAKSSGPLAVSNIIFDQNQHPGSNSGESVLIKSVSMENVIPNGLKSPDKTDTKSITRLDDSRINFSTAVTSKSFVHHAPFGSDKDSMKALPASAFTSDDVTDKARPVLPQDLVSPARFPGSKKISPAVIENVKKRILAIAAKFSGKDSQEKKISSVSTTTTTKPAVASELETQRKSSNNQLFAQNHQTPFFRTETKPKRKTHAYHIGRHRPVLQSRQEDHPHFNLQIPQGSNRPGHDLLLDRLALGQQRGVSELLKGRNRTQHRLFPLPFLRRLRPPLTRFLPATGHGNTSSVWILRPGRRERPSAADVRNEADNMTQPLTFAFLGTTFMSYRSLVTSLGVGTTVLVFSCFFCLCGLTRWHRHRQYRKAFNKMEKSFSDLDTDKPFYIRLARMRRSQAGNQFVVTIMDESKFTVVEHDLESEEEIFDVTDIVTADKKGPLARLQWTNQRIPF